jgi:signal transduction histidine kinase
MDTGNRTSTRLLVVDDDETDLAIIRRMLGMVAWNGCYLIDASRGNDGVLGRMQSGDYDCILLDVHMGHTSGNDLLEAYRRGGAVTPIVMLSGDDSNELGDALLQTGADNHLSKADLSPSALHRAIRYAIKGRQTEKANARFMASMGHEIRTPMNGVMGMLDLLDDTELDQLQQEYVDVAIRSADALTVVLNDLLDLARLSHGQMRVAPAPFAPGEIIKDVAALHRSLLDSAVRLETSIEELPATATGDAHRFRQILTNLVSNAVKFTRAGSIRLDCSRSGAAFTVRVTDTGIGISEDRQEHIFSAFTQADDSIAGRYGGTGLGLSISRQLATLMGGSLTVASVPGAGSTFTLTIPTGQPAD